MMIEIQRAIITRLKASAPIVAATVSITDHSAQVPPANEAAKFPFIQIGDDIVSTFPTDDSSNIEAVVRLHVWSVARGSKQAKEILDLIRADLDRAEISVTGFSLISIDPIQSFVVLDPDGKTRHGVIEFRLIIMSN